MDKPVLAPIVFELRGALLAAPGLDSEVVVVVLVGLGGLGIVLPFAVPA